MNKFIKKRISIMAIGIISVLLVIGAGVGFYMYVPSNMIALDINPSIELHTNRLNRVVSINSVNEDAIQLMIGYHLEDRDLETVIEDIVDRMILGGYLTESQENQILITADDRNNSEELMGRVNAAITTYLQEKQMIVQLLQQNMVVTEEEEEVAHANYVTAGKMAIVDKLLANSNGLSTEELASASIKELIRFSIDQNISLEDLIENYSEVLEEKLELEEFANTDDSQIDALSSATIKAETSVLAKDLDITKNETFVGNKQVQVDAISSATVKSDGGVSTKGEYAYGKVEDKDDYDQEDNDYEDNDYEDNDDEDNNDEDNEDNDIEDKEDQDDFDDDNRTDDLSFNNESDSDDSEEDELSYSREEDNDDEEDDDDDDDDDEDDDDEDSNGDGEDDED